MNKTTYLGGTDIGLLIRWLEIRNRLEYYIIFKNAFPCHICIRSTGFASFWSNLQLQTQNEKNVLYCGHHTGKEDAGMEKTKKFWKGTIMSLLNAVKNTAVRNAWMASYKGSYEAKVPEKLIKLK